MNKADVLEILGVVMFGVGALVLFIKNPFIILFMVSGIVVYLAGVLERTK